MSLGEYNSLTTPMQECREIFLWAGGLAAEPPLARLDGEWGKLRDLCRVTPAKQPSDAP
jgi:hypothetical protein